MPNELVHEVVRRALKDKLPKLVAAQVDFRILLLEQNIPARGTREVGEAVEDLRSDFSDLAAINQVWCANTVAWKTERFRSFLIAWLLVDAERQDIRRAESKA